MEKFYILRKKRHQWGDYFSILMHGMSHHLGRADGLIQLERTGPFVPPISFPGISDVVVTHEFREKLEASDLLGLRFQPVIKKWISESAWHTWDKNAECPLEYPETGEPEDYILQKPHSEKISNQIGNLWELLLNPSARVSRPKIVKSSEEIVLLTSSWQGEDLFLASGVGYIYASENAKSWLEKNAGGYIEFTESRTKS